MKRGKLCRSHADDTTRTTFAKDRKFRRERIERFRPTPRQPDNRSIVSLPQDQSQAVRPPQFLPPSSNIPTTKIPVRVGARYLVPFLPHPPHPTTQSHRPHSETESSARA